MLSKFQVGTEKHKSAILGPPEPSMIGPIISLPSRFLVSNEKAAMIRMRQTKNPQKSKKLKS